MGTPRCFSFTLSRHTLTTRTRQLPPYAVLSVCGGRAEGGGGHFPASGSSVMDCLCEWQDASAPLHHTHTRPCVEYASLHRHFHTGQMNSRPTGHLLACHSQAPWVLGVCWEEELCLTQPMTCPSAPPHHHDHQPQCGKDQSEDLLCKDALSLYLCIFLCFTVSLCKCVFCLCLYLYIHVFSVWSLSFQFSFDVVFVNLYAHLFF